MGQFYLTHKYIKEDLYDNSGISKRVKRKKQEQG